jgi:hypothetical protein
VRVSRARGRLGLSAAVADWPVIFGPEPWFLWARPPGSRRPPTHSSRRQERPHAPAAAHTKRRAEANKFFGQGSRDGNNMNDIYSTPDSNMCMNTTMYGYRATRWDSGALRGEATFSAGAGTWGVCGCSCPARLCLCRGRHGCVIFSRRFP